MSELTSWRERLDGRLVVASISGGKDSAAMGLWLKEQGIQHCRVFLDTGWEHQITYDYLRGPLTDALGPIEEVSGPLSMLELIKKKGMFPSKRRRFCTQELKVFPMQRHIAALMDELDAEVVNTVGIRAAESARRSQMGAWERSPGFDCEVWRPILRWSFDDVVEIHKKHALNPNPLYLQGAERVGCWPCIYARKREIRQMADQDPERIAEISALEAEVDELAANRYAKRGETFESLGYLRPAWFQAPKGRAGKPWPIERVVEWSRTSYGGNQYELFAPDYGDEGCMRWGLCDTGKTNAGDVD